MHFPFLYSDVPTIKCYPSTQTFDRPSFDYVALQAGRLTRVKRATFQQEYIVFPKWTTDCCESLNF